MAWNQPGLARLWHTIPGCKVRPHTVQPARPSLSPLCRATWVLTLQWGTAYCSWAGLVWAGFVLHLVGPSLAARNRTVQHGSSPAQQHMVRHCKAGAQVVRHRGGRPGRAGSVPCHAVLSLAAVTVLNWAGLHAGQVLGGSFASPTSSCSCCCGCCCCCSCRTGLGGWGEASAGGSCPVYGAPAPGRLPPASPAWLDEKLLWAGGWKTAGSWSWISVHWARASH